MTEQAGEEKINTTRELDDDFTGRFIELFDRLKDKNTRESEKEKLNGELTPYIDELLQDYDRVQENLDKIKGQNLVENIDKIKQNKEYVIGRTNPKEQNLSFDDVFKNAKNLVENDKKSVESTERELENIKNSLKDEKSKRIMLESKISGTKKTIEEANKQVDAAKKQTENLKARQTELQAKSSDVSKELGDAKTLYGNIQGISIASELKGQKTFKDSLDLMDKWQQLEENTLNILANKIITAVPRLNERKGLIDESQKQNKMEIVKNSLGFLKDDEKAIVAKELNGWISLQNEANRSRGIAGETDKKLDRELNFMEAELKIEKALNELEATKKGNEALKSLAKELGGDPAKMTLQGALQKKENDIAEKENNFKQMENEQKVIENSLKKQNEAILNTKKEQKDLEEANKELNNTNLSIAKLEKEQLNKQKKLDSSRKNFEESTKALNVLAEERTLGKTIEEAKWFEKENFGEKVFKDMANKPRAMRDVLTVLNNNGINIKASELIDRANNYINGEQKSNGNGQHNSIKNSLEKLEKATGRLQTISQNKNNKLNAKYNKLKAINEQRKKAEKCLDVYENKNSSKEEKQTAKKEIESIYKTMKKESNRPFDIGFTLKGKMSAIRKIADSKGKEYVSAEKAVKAQLLHKTQKANHYAEKLQKHLDNMALKTEKINTQKEKKKQPIKGLGNISTKSAFNGQSNGSVVGVAKQQNKNIERN